MNPADCELLFAGDGGRAASRPDALLSFLARHPVRGKCVALFCCRRAGSARFFRALQDALPGNIILDEAAFPPPRFWQRSDAVRPAVREWALRVISSAVPPATNASPLAP